VCYMRFEVLAKVLIKIKVFLDAALC
jgi:hypothetical protein